MNEKDLFFKRLSELSRQCFENSMITNTNFLDAEERSEAMRSGSVGTNDPIFFGGYEDAERTVCVFYPDYVDRDTLPRLFYESTDDSPIRAIRCEYAKDAPSLSHRDFLGALMALGIKREMIGDILVGDRSADIFVMPQMVGYLIENFKKAGRVAIVANEIRLSDVNLPETKTVSKRDTVPSLRLDAVIASVFSLSRAKAEEAINAGIVFVNDRQTVKTDFKVSEGSKLVMRGSGKVKLLSASDISKKGRTIILFDKYL